MRKFKLGLVVGRFQPFHLGHRYLIKRALEFCEQITIGIGSSNRKDVDNIFTYSQREKAISIFLEQEDLKSRVKKIFPIPDVPSDEEWLRLVLKRVIPDIVVGNNDWVNDIFKEAGFIVKSLPYYKRFLLEGKKIRKLIREHGSWEYRVPKYLVEEVKHIIYNQIV